MILAFRVKDRGDNRAAKVKVNANEVNVVKSDKDEGEIDKNVKNAKGIKLKSDKRLKYCQFKETKVEKVDIDVEIALNTKKFEANKVETVVKYGGRLDNR